MASFCPTCGNMLLIENGENGMRYFCQTCPYIQDIQSKVIRNIPLKKKDNIAFLEQEWQDQTEITCSKCGYNKAYYVQVQTRSADEPMTIFYKCANISCGIRWKE